MGFFDRTRYIRALIVLLPLGITLLVLGIKYTMNNPSSQDKLNKHKGVINNITSEQIYFENCKCYLEEITVHFNRNKFKTREKEKIKIFRKFISIGDEVILGFDRENYIQYLKKDNNILIVYKKSYVYSYFFIVLGFLLSSLSLYYLLKHRKDLF